jgi:tRNA-Thr(GGU) m(6)t(6)A37 methyltransferase TsaA
MSFAVDPIGYVRGVRAMAEDDYWGGEEACVELTDAFAADALAGLDAFSHAEIVFVFDRVDPTTVVVGARHPRDNSAWPRVGIFAQRGRSRPNRIGTTICRIVRVESTKLFVAELDAIDGTPVLDIKPVMAEFLPRDSIRQPTWSHELMREYWSRKT